MRKLFGGAQLPLGSSNSNEQQALQSPPASSDASSLQKQQQTTSTAGTGQGWFGSILKQAPSTPTTATNPASHQQEEDDKLPFHASKLASPSRIPLASSSSHHSRNTSLSLSHYGNANSNSKTLAEASDEIMIDLLSAQAAIEARTFPTLDWDEMQQTKKSHAALANKVAALKRSLHLETRLRDSAAKLLRSIDQDMATTNSTVPTSPAKVTREQATAQLSIAQSRIDAISGELYQVAYEEGELRTKLLQHTAAVLALAYQKKSDEERAAIDPAAAALQQRPISPASPLRASSASSHHGTPYSSRGGGARLVSMSSNASTTSDLPFYGPHFFAGNKEAVLPSTGAARSAGSPYGSPNLLSSSTFGALSPTSPVQSSSASKDASRIRELESRLSELKASYEQLQAEHASSSRELDQLRSRDADRSTSAERQLEQLRSELEDARAGIRRAEEDASRSLGDHERRADQANRALAAVRLDLEDARRAADEAESRLATFEREHESRGAETTDRLNDALRRHRNRVSIGSIVRDVPHDEQDAVGSVDSHIDALSRHVGQLRRQVETYTTNASALESQVESHASARRDLERQLAQANEASGPRRDEELDSLKQSLERAQSDKVEFDKLSSRLRDLWIRVPVVSSTVSTTSLVDPDSFKRARSSPPADASGFSIDSFVERVDTLVEHDAALLDRYVASFEEAHSSKRAHEQAQVELGKMSTQVKDMDERVNTSGEREAAMLERLNDLTESLEKTMSEKRKLEQAVQQHESDKRSLEAQLNESRESLERARADHERNRAETEKASETAGKVVALEEQVQELEDQIADLNDELEGVKQREKKGRATLLDELSAAQDEVSKLKTQLRQAARSKKQPSA